MRIATAFAFCCTGSYRSCRSNSMSTTLSSSSSLTITATDRNYFSLTESDLSHLTISYIWPDITIYDLVDWHGQRRVDLECRHRARGAEVHKGKDAKLRMRGGNTNVRTAVFLKDLLAGQRQPALRTPVASIRPGSDLAMFCFNLKVAEKLPWGCGTSLLTDPIPSFFVDLGRKKRRAVPTSAR